MPYRIAQPFTFCKKILLFVSAVCCTHYCFAQTEDTTLPKQMQEVIVRAFEQNRKLKDIPAAINYIGPQTLQRFSPMSIVSAINTTPGVRMEERSPGSYRINIRGSSLRSTFGVRNVKIYFNDIPFTDPGGNTYLNQLGYYNFNSIEIIKGPGSSLYGAGTGGVMLIESLTGHEANGVGAEYATGSYNLQNAYASLTTGNDNNKSRIGFQYQKNDGYRAQSALRRDVFSWNGLYRLNDKQQIKTTFVYGDLYYQTPGALTLAEYNANPRAARPATPGFLSAQQSRAAIFQKTFLTGASFLQKIGNDFQNTTTLYGAFTELKNPTIRNYGKSSEPHTGGRTVFTFQKDVGNTHININAGAEVQQNFSTSNIYNNKNGNADSLQTNDDIHVGQAFAFLQAVVETHNWIITGGASVNQMKVNFHRYYPAPLPEQIRTFNNEIAPRLAVAKKFSNITLYTSVARGFSPPTSAELLPSGSNINLSLNAEHGINYDMGMRATFFHQLYVDINAFTFSLNNAIVQRRDAGGGDYYVNSGSTDQKGIETYISYPLFQSSPFMERSLFWLSHTWHDFHYKSFKQLTTDFSGNQLPAEAPHTVSTGFDFVTKKGWLATITYFFSDKIPLDDGNTSYANAYHLIGAKIGYEKWMQNKTRIKIFVGADNLLNQKYSLGNDINAFGGRYYNAAPGRNYFASMVFNFNFKSAQ